ncbi:MAG: F0F1 ATP synthase subunit B [Candidatus Zixiibacteriota bacterium]|nr:MAG: F0F1 ATP synthase subunit B [candidate division Zixibacteria bacterium]
MGEIAHSLDLNWGLIVTQIIGFLLTVWILKAFAWKPLLKMLEDRRNKIAGDIDDAEKIKSDAESLLDDYNAKLRDIETEARSKIQDAVAEGNRIASEIRDHAREEAQKIVEKSREELSRDVAKARVQLRDDMVSMAITAAEKVISAKLDEAEQKRLLEDFLKEVE